MKDHEIAKLVNDLRDIAVEFGQTQQLRQRIHSRLVPEIELLRNALAEKSCFLCNIMERDICNEIRHDLIDEVQRLRNSRIRLAKIAADYRRQLLRFKLAHAIHNDAEHKIVMDRIGKLMPSDPMPDTPEGEELSLLVALAMAYEVERYPGL